MVEVTCLRGEQALTQAGHGSWLQVVGGLHSSDFVLWVTSVKGTMVKSPKGWEAGSHCSEKEVKEPGQLAFGV